MEKVIEVKNLTKMYRDKIAVDNLTFEVERGTFFGLLGMNGAGKSTTIECILDTKKKDKGKITILGVDPIKERKNLLSKVGVQFQDCAYPNLITVKELCEMTAASYQKPQNYKELLSKFGLLDKMKNKVSSLSGGERQRLFIILALLPNPEIIFLDELTTGLDTLSRKEVWEYLLELKGKVTILLTSHYMDEIEKLCDIIAILNKGKLVFNGQISEAIEISGKTNLEEAYEWFGKEVKI